MARTTFTTSPRRDARGAIKGFVYQVDITLLRWLSLVPQETLILECGEDIDRIATAIERESRLLEQVKVRKRLSLQSVEAREAIARFAEHRAWNPDLPLAFRFITTAQPSKERQNWALADPGIVVWEAVRSGPDAANSREKALRILEFLRTVKRPPKLARDAWEPLQVFLRSANADDFVDFVRAFEWSTSAGQPEEVVEQVRHIIASRENCSPEKSITKQEHLFAYVFRLLSRADEKRLTGQDLQRELAATTADAEEQGLHKRIRELRGWLDEEFRKVREELRHEVKRIDIRLDRLDAPDVARPGLPLNIPSLLRQFRNVSDELLRWPQQIVNRWIERPELAEVERLIQRNEFSFTVLVGPPGSGKSALLARLGNRLLESGISLLAIKADHLPKNLRSLEDLDKTLGVPDSLSECVKRLAKEGPVVLLIDQLDALAELMDQHTQRLFVMLALINCLRDVPGVHLVLSCREFELRHDTRLSTLKAKPVRLPNFKWSEVQDILATKGIDPSRWPQETRELLRRPQHLSMFMEQLAADEPQPVFETYQGMLEEVCQKRIIKDLGSGGMEACEKLATAVSESEELWLPKAQFDSMAFEIDRLLGAGILKTDSKGVRIGFNHQTLFEFVRARGFAKSQIPLADFVLQRQNGVFFRPILWQTLYYLRASNRPVYRQQFTLLWTAQTLRLHVRYLLIAFLGQLSDPDEVEIGWIRPALSDPALRPRVLRAIAANTGWFDKVNNRLPELMRMSLDVGWECVPVLSGALESCRSQVLDLLENTWLGDSQFSEHVLGVFRELKIWDERSVKIAERAIQTSEISRVYVQHLAENVAAGHKPDLAPRLVLAQMRAELERAREEAVTNPPPSPNCVGSELAVAFRRLRYREEKIEPFKRLICDRSGWYELHRIAEKAPESFVQYVWPWFLEVCSLLKREPRGASYMRSLVPELDDDYTFAGRPMPIVQALRVAVVGFARSAPERFWRFVDGSQSNDMMIVHCLLARGLEEVVEERPKRVFRYLTEDPRRLAIGGCDDIQSRTKRLIAKLLAHLNTTDAQVLEEVITSWNLYVVDSTAPPDLRRDRLKWNRECRLRLLRVLPKARLSQRGLRIREQEERALPHTRDYDDRIEGGWVASPMKASQMGRAKDKNILRALFKFPDDTGGHHPESPILGGSVQISQEFGEFAKRNPQRALRLLARFEAGKQERPAGAALAQMAKEGSVAPKTVVKQIHELVSRGFNSEDFRVYATWAFEDVARKGNGLDSHTCSLLESWVVEASVEQTEVLEDENVRPGDPVLWQTGSLNVPHGNFPVLRTLTVGLLTREPPAFDEWLTVLERHLGRREKEEVWKVLAWLDLRYLRGVSDRTRAVNFLSALFGRYPQVLASQAGAVLVANCHRWVPEEKVVQWAESWVKSAWQRGAQALGEFAMLRFAILPGDEWSKRVVEDIITGSSQPSESLALMRLGIAHSATHLWAQSRCRSACGEVIRRLTPVADGEIGKTIANVLWLADSLPADSETERMLVHLAEHEQVIDAATDGFPVDKLSEALRKGANPEPIAEFAKAIVEPARKDMGDIQRRWALGPDKLVDLSLTLQRYPETRETGIDLFERLIEVGVYEAEQVLRVIDKRM